MHTLYRTLPTVLEFSQVRDAAGQVVDLTGLTLNVVAKQHANDVDGKAVFNKAILLTNNTDSISGIPKMPITVTESTGISQGFYHLGIAIIHPDSTVVYQGIEYLTVADPGEMVNSPTVVADTDPPVITLLGDSLITLEYGSTYVDAGATAHDNIGGDITADIIAVNSVNTSLLGSYTVTYTVSDLAGNTTVGVRNVNIVDTQVPVITLNCSALVQININDPYSDAGATALDDYDGDITANIILGGDTVDTAIAGTYQITYNVSDSSGNAASQVVRSVQVIQTTTFYLLAENDDRLLFENGDIIVTEDAA